MRFSLSDRVCLDDPAAASREASSRFRRSGSMGFFLSDGESVEGKPHSKMGDGATQTFLSDSEYYAGGLAYRVSSKCRSSASIRFVLSDGSSDGEVAEASCSAAPSGSAPQHRSASGRTMRSVSDEDRCEGGREQTLRSSKFCSSDSLRFLLSDGHDLELDSIEQIRMASSKSRKSALKPRHCKSDLTMCSSLSDYECSKSDTVRDSSKPCSSMSMRFFLSDGETVDGDQSHIASSTPRRTTLQKIRKTNDHLAPSLSDRTCQVGVDETLRFFLSDGESADGGSAQAKTCGTVPIRSPFEVDRVMGGSADGICETSMSRVGGQSQSKQCDGVMRYCMSDGDSDGGKPADASFELDDESWCASAHNIAHNVIGNSAHFNLCDEDNVVEIAC